MTNGIKEQVRFQYLDALRGIAAVSVCFHHLFNYLTARR
jgi:peptidoglycan/LPS O-acetylase OafA/YrhL